MINLDHVTAIEARMMDAPLSPDREPDWELIAYRKAPMQDVVLLSLLRRETALGVVDALTASLSSRTEVTDVVELAETVRAARTAAAAADAAAATAV